MKTKVLFYALFAMVFAGSVSMTEMESTKLADAVTVASTVNSDERSPAEKREEGYEYIEAKAEYDLPLVNN
ncbi:hypothetical protein A9Q86_08565 [Flavobacteriales bacterium 33_180_T64]|nr:hypothetical protein A9Q86_08565 [Flavobacteriales bacterium 33_180_T64]